MMLFTNPLAAAGTSDSGAAAAAADSVTTFFVTSPIANEQPSNALPPRLPPVASYQPQFASCQPPVVSSCQLPTLLLKSSFVVDGATVDNDDDGMDSGGFGFAPMGDASDGGGDMAVGGGGGGGGCIGCCLLPPSTVSSQESSDFATDAVLSMCVNPTDVFAAGVSTAMMTTATIATPSGISDGCGQQLATATGNICCPRDVVFNSEQQGGRRRSSARSLVSLPPGMVDSDADGEDEDMLMDEINWDKLL